MKQVVQNLRGEVRLLELPPPVVRDGGVLVRTTSSLVSPGTERTNVERSRRSLVSRARERPELVRQVVQRLKRDGIGATLRSVSEKLDSWIPMGYSSAGIVEAVGTGAEEFQPGDRVACAGGGYAAHAELVWIPKHLCARLPAMQDGSDLSFESGAFATLGAIALQGIRQANPTLGETVAVTGLGLLGLLTVQLLQANGCRVIASDPDPARRALAKTLGAIAVASPGAEYADLVDQWTRGIGADAVIITAGTDSPEPVREAGAISRDRGRVIIVGAVRVDVPRSPYFEKEIEVRFSRSYGPGRYDPHYEEGGNDYPIGYVRWTEQRNLSAFLELVAAGKVTLAPLISHRFPIDQAPKAYELLTGGAEPCLGILLGYEQEPDRRRRFQPATGTPKGGALGVGLVGIGSFARNVLLPAIRAVPDVQLRGVAAGTGVTVASATERGGFAFGSTDAAEVINDADTRVVFIATRHHLHATQVIAALEAGKDVFVEKPLCIVESDLEAIHQALESAESKFGPRRLMVGFNRRFAPLTVKLTELMGRRAGPIHLNYVVNAGEVPPGNWVHDPAVGGGRIIGEGCHFLDYAGGVIGAQPLRVSAEASAADSLVALVKYQDGSTASVSYLAGGDPSVSKERIEVIGNGGIYQLDDFKSLRWANGAGKGLQDSKLQDKGHRAEVAAFLAAVAKGAAAPIGVEELFDSMRLTFRAVEAAASGSGLAV